MSNPVPLSEKNSSCNAAQPPEARPPAQCAGSLANARTAYMSMTREASHCLQAHRSIGLAALWNRANLITSISHMSHMVNAHHRGGLDAGGSAGSQVGA